MPRTSKPQSKPKPYKVLAAVALAVLGLVATGCGEPPPTVIDIDIFYDNQNNNGVQPTPAPSASPGSPGAATRAKVTIIGGDGSKTVRVGQAFTVTFTRFDDQNREVHGNPSDPVDWIVLGAVDDREAGSADGQNYNRDLKAKDAPGTFSVTAVQGELEATLAGNVIE